MFEISLKLLMGPSFVYARSRYVQTPILATLVSSKFANFGNRQCLPILATDDTCQFWKLTTFANFGN